MKTNSSTETLALTTHVAELLVAVVNRTAEAGNAEANPALGPLLLHMLAPEVDLTSVVADELERAFQI